MDERGYAYLIGWSTDFSRPGQASTDCSVVHTAGYSSHPATRQRRHPTPWLLLPLCRRWCALSLSLSFLPIPLYHRARIHVRTYAHTQKKSPSPDRSAAEESSRKIASVSYTARSRARFYLPSENVDCNISLPLNRTRLSLSPSFSWTNIVQTDTIAWSSRFLTWQRKKTHEDAFNVSIMQQSPRWQID